MRSREVPRFNAQLVSDGYERIVSLGCGSTVHDPALVQCIQASPLMNVPADDDVGVKILNSLPDGCAPDVITGVDDVDARTVGRCVRNKHFDRGIRNHGISGANARSDFLLGDLIGCMKPGERRPRDSKEAHPVMPAAPPVDREPKPLKQFVMAGTVHIPGHTHHRSAQRRDPLECRLRFRHGTDGRKIPADNNNVGPFKTGDLLCESVRAVDIGQSKDSHLHFNANRSIMVRGSPAQQIPDSQSVRTNMVFSQTISRRTNGFTDIQDITDELRTCLRSSRIHHGTMTVFVPGSTAGITTIEFEPGVIQDLRDAIERMAPQTLHYRHDARWGDGNGFAHVRAALLGASISIPVNSKELQLGTWQQVVLVDFDNRSRDREVIIQIVGESK